MTRAGEVEEGALAARLGLLEALSGLEPPWPQGELSQIHRLVRDPEVGIWALAAQVLGERADLDPGAAGELLALLGSESEELRLRGLSALGSVEGEVSERFLVERLEQALERGDPVELDGVLRALLPIKPSALHVLLEDPREMVRAAVVPHLPLDDRGELLERLALDPSVRVRAALASRGAEGLPEPTLWRLAADPDPVVRRLLVEELVEAPPSARPFLELLSADPDPLVQASPALGGEDLAPVEADPAPRLPDRCRELERRLDRASSRALELLRPALEEPDAGALLEGAAGLARDPSLARLCRALSRLGPPDALFEPQARERLLACLGQLPERGPEELETLRLLLRLAVGALEGQAGWGSPFWIEAVDSGRLPGPAGPWLLRVAEVAGRAAPAGLIELATLNLTLEAVRRELPGSCPQPERSLLDLLFSAWSDHLEARISQSVGGACP